MANLKYVKVVPEMAPAFEKAEQVVEKYFGKLKLRAETGQISVDKDHYALFSTEDFGYFLHESFRDRFGSAVKMVLYEMAYILGQKSAQRFARATNAAKGLELLSYGPVYFAFIGMANVEILPISKPSPDDEYMLAYHHHHSFEADSYLAQKESSSDPVCYMSSGFSAGWCSEAFDLDLKAEELCCRAQGHDKCTFVMAPRKRIFKHSSKLKTELGL